MHLGTIHENNVPKTIFDISLDNESNLNAASLSTLELAKIHHTIETNNEKDERSIMLKSIEIDDYTSTPLKPLQNVKGFRG